mmetsp:Transcript_39877/g.78630  ORF Transcript_39877/g.78630 Transcript_39877/m.78630 type:complete len:100 (-) Transcript_39877:412-711(-)
MLCVERPASQGENYKMAGWVSRRLGWFQNGRRELRKVKVHAGRWREGACQCSSRTVNERTNEERSKDGRLHASSQNDRGEKKKTYGGTHSVTHTKEDRA